MGRRNKKRKRSSSSSDEPEANVGKLIKRLHRIIKKVDRKHPKAVTGEPVSGSEEAEENVQIETNNQEYTEAEHLEPQAEVETKQAALNPQLLRMLGQQAPQSKPLVDIHTDVATIWNSILSSGLAEEIQTELVAKYQTLPSCPLMAPPRVNKEVCTSVSEAYLTRDNRLVKIQSRLQAALSALGGTITILLEKTDRTPVDTQILSNVSDAARLLADVYYEQSQARRAILKSTLNKDLADTLTEVAVDGWLFGDHLADRLNAAKTLEKTSGALKARPAAVVTKTRKSFKNLNFRGPLKPHTPSTRQGGPPQAQRRTYTPREKTEAYRNRPKYTPNNNTSRYQQSSRTYRR